jgi:hypothetical protein
MIATAPRRLNIDLPAFARGIFHTSITLDQVAQWSTFQNGCAPFSTNSRSLE